MQCITKLSNIYNISADKDFFRTLAGQIIERFRLNYKYKNVIILLPTNHACFSLKNILSESGYKNLNIHSISDLSKLVTLRKNKVPLSRIALVTKISQMILKMRLPKFKDLSSIAPLAEYFANFIHNIELHQIDFNHIIKMLDEDLSIHQQELFIILKDFITLWQKEDFISKAAYNNLLIDELTENLTNQTIIMAGISYNIPSITKLMSKILSLDNSLVVFYGLDSTDWNNADITHGQYNFKQLFTKLGISPIQEFNSSFISNALKPSKLSSNWHNLAKQEISNINYLNCLDLHHEAKSIINILQNISYKKAMVITADDSLMVKIILNLNGANIDANIIRDYPLKQSDSGIWLQLCLNLLIDKFSLLSSLSLLKHPLANIDQEIILQIEILMRDKNFYGNSIFDISLEDEKFISLLNSFQKVKAVFSHRSISFQKILEAHMNFSQEIANTQLWESSEGVELKNYLDQLLENSENLGQISPKNYSQVFSHFIQSAYYRPESLSHSITVSKPIDARLHTADLIILAGLNEGIWPSKQAIDPCLNHNLLKKIGLPQIEQAISEDAYDFQCFAHAKQVIFSRSEKIAGAVTTPSRWLLRMLTLAGDAIKPFALSQYNKDIAIKDNSINYPAPPLEYRPTQLSVTQIDKLVFNPYHIYVDTILKLKKLPPLEKELSALDFGIFIHRALEIYHHSHDLLSAGKQALAELNLNNFKLQLIYWTRFTRIAKWFIANQNLSNKIYLEASGKILIGNNFTLTARADRIEISPDNAVHVIDYKTGRLPSIKSIKSGKSLQVLLEGMIGEKGGFYFQKKPQKLGSLTYLQLSGGEEPVEMLEIEMEEKIVEYIQTLIGQYQDQATPYYYTKKKKLGYCEYEHLSREF